MKGRIVIGALGIGAALAAAPAAWASTTSGLAIDTWLHSVLASFVGPVAYAGALIGVVMAGARLMSGGDLYGFFRSMIMLTVITGLIFGGQTVIGAMSANAAVVALSGASPTEASPYSLAERSV